MSSLAEVWGKAWTSTDQLDPKLAALLEQLCGVLAGFTVPPMTLDAHDYYSLSKFAKPGEMFNGMMMKSIYRNLIVNTVNRYYSQSKVSCRSLTNADITQLRLPQNRPVEYFVLSNEAVNPPQRKLFSIQPHSAFITELEF